MISLQTANAVVDFFRNDPKYGGNYVIGGIPDNWRTMDAGWQEHFKKYQCVLPWMSRTYAEDVADFKKLGLSYYAHVMPGFSWANLKHLPTGDDSMAYAPRDGGRYYWNQLTAASQAGADRVFVGMFDEYDEGTAIMPMSDDVPPTPVRNGVAATFYNGAHPQEGGDLVLLPAAEIALGATTPAKRISATDFFVRMGGQILFPADGSYKFSVEGAPGDDADLILNGKKILAVRNLGGIASSTTAVIARQGDAMPFRIEYRHRTGTGTFRLLWEGQAITRQPVPRAALRDAWGRFLTNEGKPSDRWLMLTKSGKQKLDGKRGSEFPTR